MYDTTYYESSASAEGVFAILGAFFGIICLFFVVFAVISIIANWKIFTKAGKPGWATLVPFYCNYVAFEVVGMPGWMFLLLMIPFVNFVMMIIQKIKLAQAFGKSNGFAVGLIFLSPIFLLILAFDNSTYCLNNN